jgi:nucleotide-binding universal stress UspA family protein
MFQTILVCITQTDNQTNIVQQAACIAQKMQARVLVYHPFSFTIGSDSNFVDPLNWSLKKTEAESTVKQIIEQLNQQKIQAEGEVVENHNPDTFIEYAKQNDVSMFIIERSDSTKDLLHELMKSSAIPVLSLPSTYAQVAPQCFKRILLPLDGSKRAECTLPYAIALSEKLHSPVVAAHIVQPPVFTRSGSFNDEKITMLSDQVVETNRQNARDYLKQLIKHFSVPVYGHVIVNTDIPSSIHQLIEDEAIDLVILSAHGTGGNPKWPYGSVANNLISYSLAPVLLVQDLPASQMDEQPTQTNQRLLTHR